MTYRPALALLLAALAPAAALRWGSAPGGTRRNRAASPPASRSARRASRRPGRTPPWSARRRRRTGCSGGSAGAPAPTPGRSPRVGARCGGRCAGRWLSARRRRRWGSSRSLICAGLLVCVTEAPLLAQSTADRTEFAVGGGFHVSPDITDFIQLPAVPTVNVRVTRWLNDRWGITGNVIAGVGSGGRKLDRGVHDRLAAQAERAGISEPVYLKDPTYIQFLIRYRMRMRRLSGEEAGHLYFGIGAGAVGVSERTSSPAGLTPENAAPWVRAWGRHLLNLEVLGSWALTDRLRVDAKIDSVFITWVRWCSSTWAGRCSV